MRFDPWPPARRHPRASIVFRKIASFPVAGTAVRHGRDSPRAGHILRPGSPRWQPSVRAAGTGSQDGHARGRLQPGHRPRARGGHMHHRCYEKDQCPDHRLAALKMRRRCRTGQRET